MLVGPLGTYMHVDRLSVTLNSTDSGRHNDECVLVHKVPDTSFLAAVLGVCREIELQRLRER